MLIKMNFSPSAMSNSASLWAVWGYNASTYFTFFAPRLGATTGPCFFLPAPAMLEDARDALELEYNDGGRSVASVPAGVGSSSRYAVGTRPSLPRPAWTLVHPPSSGSTILISAPSGNDISPWSLAS